MRPIASKIRSHQVIAKSFEYSRYARSHVARMANRSIDRVNETAIEGLTQV